jgi:hypothetical protein
LANKLFANSAGQIVVGTSGLVWQTVSSASGVLFLFDGKVWPTS